MASRLATGVWCCALLGAWLAADSAPLLAQNTATDIALRYVQDRKQDLGLSGSDVSEVVVSSSVLSEYSGFTHVYLQQRYRGIDVWNGIITVNVRADGTVLSAPSNFVSNLAAAVVS